MRSPMRRRSASIWVAPGPPMTPKPPRCRSRWVHDRTRRLLQQPELRSCDWQGYPFAPRHRHGAFAGTGRSQSPARWLYPLPTAGGRYPLQYLGVPIRSLSSRSILAAFEQLDRSAGHDGRDRVLVDKLRMTVAPQQQAEIVKPGDNPLQLHSIDEKDRQWRVGFANVV